jgi:alpha-galactosidase
MILISTTDPRHFHLTNGRISYAFRATDEGLLEHLHFGAAITDPQPRARVMRHCTVMLEDNPDLSLNDLAQEFPTRGRGDFRAPIFAGRGAENTVFDFRYVSHDVLAAKPELSGMPSAREGDSQSLRVVLRDAVQGVEAALHYTIWAEHDVIAKYVELRNIGTETVHLRRAASTALDLPPGEYDVQHLHGTWARECNVERFALPTTRVEIDSARGTSSNAHLPYLALVSPDATETAGACWGTTLVYSGNHAMSVECGEFGGVRLLAGMGHADFDWPLAPGKSFATPEALHAYSSEGLGGLSHIWHGFIREHISPPRWKGVARPTYLNTWEAAYFDIDAAKVLAAADRAVDIGVDMLVVDDGWFSGRIDATRALGDWTADAARFPDGIPALAEQVRAKGLKFGLWFEPEMVSPNSDLYRAHPDWAIRAAGRVPCQGRDQLTLDLSQPEVVDHIFAQLDTHLSSGVIDYVKWDMNRNMTEVADAAQAHRYMLGLYDLLSRITTAYPDVLFESCASGGNRFDLGMLAFMAQTWTSDMVDPIGRVAILNGATQLFPLDVLAAYIGPSPNHQNGRVSSLQARAVAGHVCAAQGVSLNAEDIADHLDDLRDYMASAKSSAALRLGARFDRLHQTDNETIWQQTSESGSWVQVCALQICNAPNLPARRVQLRGLDPTAQYATPDGVRYGGDQLMAQGLPLSPATADFHAEAIVLHRCLT